MSEFYNLSAEIPGGTTLPMGDFQGKVVLCVNLASKCGFTKQYSGLEALYQKYKDQGLVILGFPCNQFGGQEPGDDATIAQFCKNTYDVTFPVTKKTNVNGSDAHPIYNWLKAQKSGYLGLTLIKWNFEKFLVGKDGKVIQRYGSTTTPDAIAADVEKALAA